MPRHSTNWLSQEDQILQSLVKRNNRIDWKQIAEKIQTKTPQQCKNRWEKHLNLQINKRKWDYNQIKIVFDRHKQYGGKWTKIASHLKNRTDDDIKNQFNNTVRKGLRKIGKIGQEVSNSTVIVKKMKSSRIFRLLSNESKINDYRFNKDSIYNVLFECSKKEEPQQVQRLKQSQSETKKHYAALFKMFQEQCIESQDSISKQRNRQVEQKSNKDRRNNRKKNDYIESQNQNQSLSYNLDQSHNQDQNQNLSHQRQKISRMSKKNQRIKEKETSVGIHCTYVIINNQQYQTGKTQKKGEKQKKIQKKQRNLEDVNQIYPRKNQSHASNLINVASNKRSNELLDHPNTRSQIQLININQNGEQSEEDDQVYELPENQQMQCFADDTQRSPSSYCALKELGKSGGANQSFKVTNCLDIVRQKQEIAPKQSLFFSFMNRESSF